MFFKLAILGKRVICRVYISSKRCLFLLLVIHLCNPHSHWPSSQRPCQMLLLLVEAEVDEYQGKLDREANSFYFTGQAHLSVVIPLHQESSKVFHKEQDSIQSSNVMQFLDNYTTINDTQTNVHVLMKFCLQEWTMVLIWFADFWKKGRTGKELVCILAQAVRARALMGLRSAVKCTPQIS